MTSLQSSRTKFTSSALTEGTCSTRSHCLTRSARLGQWGRNLRASKRCSAVGYFLSSYSTPCSEWYKSPENSPFPLNSITEGMTNGVSAGPLLLTAADGTDIVPPSVMGVGKCKGLEEAVGAVDIGIEETGTSKCILGTAPIECFETLSRGTCMGMLVFLRITGGP